MDNTNDKSPWQLQIEALPEWAQKMTRALTGCVAYGVGGNYLLSLDSEKYQGFNLSLCRQNSTDWRDGFQAMLDLAQASTAPWPPPVAPEREKREFNVVELATEDDDSIDGGFDQPCCFGNRVESHAVYCHNDEWPNHPRKCRRNREDYLHEDCPGFVANPDIDTQSTE